MAVTPAAARPPSQRLGPIAWARSNLFNSVSNSITTILLLAALAYAIPPLFGWAFTNSVVEADPVACRAASGACWGFVAEKYRLMAFGTYPYDEQWRPLLASTSLVLLIVVSCIPAVWGRSLVAAWLIGIPAILVLMSGELSYTLLALALIGVGVVIGLPPLLFATLGGGLLAIYVIGWLLSFVVDVPSIIPPLPPIFSPVETSRWGGLPLTLILATFGIALSFPLAVLLALGRASNLPAIKVLCIGFIELVRGVPLITVLFMASLMIPLFLPEGVNFDKLLRAQIGFILFAAAYVAEVIRGGLAAIPKGQYEAAEALGLGYWKKMGFIILPQALKHVIAPLVNTFIGLFKDTSLVIIIGMFDLLGAVEAAASDPEWRPFYVEGLIVVAVVYFIFCYAMATYARWIEVRLDTSNR